MSIVSFPWEEYAEGTKCHDCCLAAAVASHCMDEKRPASLSLMLWNNRVIIDKDFPIKSRMCMLNNSLQSSDKTLFNCCMYGRLVVVRRIEEEDAIFYGPY